MVAYDVQLGLVEARQPARFGVLLDKGIDASEPVANGRGFGQGEGRIVRDHPARLGGMVCGQVTRPAAQFGAWFGLHHQGCDVGGRTAR